MNPTALRSWLYLQRLTEDMPFSMYILNPLQLCVIFYNDSEIDAEPLQPVSSSHKNYHDNASGRAMRLPFVTVKPLLKVSASMLLLRILLALVFERDLFLLHRKLALR
jgi:hypothetical protein